MSRELKVDKFFRILIPAAIGLVLVKWLGLGMIPTALIMLASFFLYDKIVPKPRRFDNENDET